MSYHVEEESQVAAGFAPVMIWAAGENKECTYFNQRWLDFRGRTFEEEQGFGWLDGVHPDDREACFQTFTRSIEARESFRMECRLQRYDGVYRWILFFGTPRFDPDGTFNGFIGSCVDNTACREAEVGLEGRMRRKTVVADLGAYAIGQIDIGRLMEEASRRICEVLNVDACRVLRLQADRSTFLIRTGVMLQDGRYVPYQSRTGTDALASTALRVGDAVIVQDFCSDEQFEDPGSLHITPYASGLAVIIGRVTRPYGVLMVHTSRPRAFTRDDASFLKSIANLLYDVLLRKRIGNKLTQAGRELRRRVTERASESLEASTLLKHKAAELSRSEEALRQSEADFRGLLESLPDGVAVMTLEGIVLDVNPAACRLTGLGREDLIGRHVRELVPPEKLSETLENYEKLVSGELTQLESYSFRSDGSIVPVVVRASRFMYQGKPAMLIHVNDISEQRHAYEQLRREKEFSDLLINSSFDGILAFDRDLRYTVWNSGMERITGIPKDRCLGRVASEVLPFLSEIGEDWYQKATLNGEYVVSQNRRYRIPETGREGYFEAQYFPLRSPEGEIVGGVAIVRDKTAQKSTVEALRQSEERFAKAFQAAPVAMVITRLGSGRVVDANEAFTRMSEYRRAEVIGRKASDLGLSVHRVLRDRVTDILEEGYSYVDVETQIATKSGAQRDVLSSGEFIEFGGETCLLSMFYDITERKRLEREILEIAEAERRRIGQDLHDGLGQQLTGIAFLGRILERNLESISPEHAAQMRRIADLVSQAINYTRNLSRMLSPVDIPAEGLTNALRRLVESTAEFSDVQCRFDCEGDLPLSSNSAATHLYRITQEGINNALKHASPTEIVVELLAQEGQGVLRIRDNGKGIPEGAAKIPSGMGMRTMEYRSNVIGGALKIYAGEGGGTVVECRFPIG